MRLNAQRIPQEMRGYHQWIVWRYEDRNAKKPTKVPYDPRTGLMASVIDPVTWCDFDTALAILSAGTAYNGLGFVLTGSDPYTFIDLDDCGGKQVDIDRQIKIYQEFDSYSERSPSGTGLHIIVKGHIPQGRRRSSIELYSSERYMTMTGDVFNDKPIQHKQDVLQLLWAQMGTHSANNTHTGDEPETMTDQQVVEKALNAVNGVKFNALLCGNFTEFYPSQSEADFAFIDIIAFYTQNRAQIIRIFSASPLGQRDKAKRPDYVNRMILRAFDNLLPPINIIDLKNKTDAQIQEIKHAFSAMPHVKSTDDTNLSRMKKFWIPQPITPPPGLLGEMARFIYAASPRPVAETAITAAIGMLAGIAGRAFNVSGTGLNQYVLLLAPTGTGKEALAGGIGKLFDAIKTAVPASADFRGPSEIASGQALLKTIDNPNKRSFVSIVGEFGLKLQQLASPRASSSELMLKRVLLDLYNKSGHSDKVMPSIYAAKEKDTDVIDNPAVSILGESTPETFYDSIDEKLITDGLLPRFIIIEYTGKRPPRNKAHTQARPSFPLIESLAEITGYSLLLQRENQVINVETDDAALAFLDEVDRLVDEAINDTTTDVLRHLWNRAHLKTLKLAALVAVGCNFTQPVITEEIAKWAYNLVSADVVGIVSRFSRGEIGKNTDENKQGVTVLNLCAEYLSRTFKELRAYQIDETLHADRIITYNFISKRVAMRGVFRNDKMGASTALKRTVQGLLDAGDLQEVGRHTLQQKYAYHGRAFVIPRPEKLAASMVEQY
jgi:hypothetical protein